MSSPNLGRPIPFRPGPTIPGGCISGWGIALPDKTITNEDLADRLGTADGWIAERTGIRERRVGGTTGGLAAEAGSQAIARAGLTPADIDLVVLATTTPDMAIPASASFVQNALGITGGAFDLNAACSGFVYSLIVGHGLLATGAERILVVGSETLSRIVDWDDRNTAILFADGAGAVVLESTTGPGQLLGWDLGSDGELRHLLYAEVGDVMKMDGREIFRRAVRITVESAIRALERSGLTPADVDAVVPHQANIRILHAACERLGIDPAKAVTVLETTGNTSAASVPLALAHGLDTGAILDGDTVLMVGFGAGMTWASAVLDWHGPNRVARLSA